MRPRLPPHRQVGERIGAQNPLVVVAGRDKVVLFAEGVDKETCKAASRALSERLHLHTSGFDVRPIDTVPLLASGKTDYRALEARLAT